MTKILCISDQHAHPDYHNNRADWLANYIIDAKPDIVVNIGDAADMPSLASYEKGKRSFHGRNYRADVDSHLDFQERLWGPVRARKKKLPHRVVLEGNHEHRVERALDLSPELDGAISFNHFEFDAHYDEVIRYRGMTPGKYTTHGVSFAHYFVSGVMGRPIGGEHPATSLIGKQLHSCVAGHLHLADWSCRTDALGRKIMGAITGVYQDYDSDWAGDVNRLWWRGVLMMHNVENGVFDPDFVSIERLRTEYGN